MPSRPLRILVVEDDLDNQVLILRHVKRLGHIATVVSDGAEAVAMATHQEFDLALMDVHMPLMNGFEALAAIRRAECHNCTMPIVAVTALSDTGFWQKCLDAGFDSYIAKPLAAEDLKAIIEEVASCRRSRYLH